MLGRELRRRNSSCILSGLSISTFSPLRFRVAVPFISRSSFWSAKDLVTKREGLALGVFESRGLLVGQPRIVAGVDAGDETEFTV